MDRHTNHVSRLKKIPVFGERPVRSVDTLHPKQIPCFLAFFQAIKRSSDQAIKRSSDQAIKRLASCLAGFIPLDTIPSFD